MLRPLAVLAFAVLVAAPALAAEHAFVLTNKTDAAVTRVVVRGGELADFRTVAANGERSFTLVLPDGVCDTRLTIVLEDQNIVFDHYDACNQGGIDVTY